MNVQNFSFPTPILFGAGAISQLPQRLTRLGITRPLVVTDAGLAGTPTFTRLQQILSSEMQNKHWFLFTDVHPNPIEQDVKGAAIAFRENGCNGVIAFGGGSPLDAGKAARLLVKRPDMRLADFDFNDDWSGLAPLVCIPTTAGTGSEVGRSSVITPAGSDRKKVIFHPELLAKQVILDAELTRDLPPKLTAATGADALTHCIESFTCPVFHPMCDGIALEGIHIIIQALPRAYNNGADMEARGSMLIAASMGAVSFQKDLGAVHALAHPLSSVCGLHHGLANALCLTAVMRFNSERKLGLYRRIGIACGLDLASASDKEADLRTIEFIDQFLKRLSLSGRLSEYGVKESHIEILTTQAVADPCLPTNAVPVNESEIKNLYKNLI